MGSKTRCTGLAVRHVKRATILLKSLMMSGTESGLQGKVHGWYLRNGDIVKCRPSLAFCTGYEVRILTRPCVGALIVVISKDGGVRDGALDERGNELEKDGLGVQGLAV